MRYTTIIAVVALAAWAANGCTRVPGGHSEKKSLSEPDRVALLASVKLDFEQRDFAAAEAGAVRLLISGADFAGADEVYFIAARSSQMLGAHEHAIKYALAGAERFVASEYREETMFVAAQSYVKLGQYYEGADLLSGILESPVDVGLEGRVLSALSGVREQLSGAEVDRLLSRYPASPLEGDVLIGLARREFARGNYDRAYELLADLLYRSPDHKRAPEVRTLLNLVATRREDPDRHIEHVVSDKVGLILPLTGGFSRFGRYFIQGATLAVEEYNATSDDPVSVVTVDSRGNPVDAVGAVRKLVVEEGVVAVLGSVLSMPSIAAAIECNAWKVPMLSPVGSDQPIDEIGPWIFEMRVSKEVEASAIARVSRETLSLSRFAVLAPSSPDRKRIAEFFVEEIRHRGGEVVMEAYYTAGATDFREQIEAIREAAPEAVFVPGTTEELINLLPQISFYDLHVQLLGMSNWNSEKLLRFSAQELEGAVFPREGYQGKDRRSYEQFTARYREVHGGEAHPVALAAYFGMRLLLQSLAAGAVDRGQVRDFLHSQLDATAASRMAQAQSLSILRVRGGKAVEFVAANRR